jgi:glycosyltransferase involved in cell wall biosynthesis
MMPFIWVLIATRGRLKKLEDTLASLPSQADSYQIEPLIVCDGDLKTYKALPETTTKLLVPEHKGATYCRNYALERTTGPVLYATDDILFHPGAIKNAIEAMGERFPAWDGVVGFTQKGNSFNPAGVALVGQRFLERYPNRHLFFEGYYHFACQEVHRAAQALGKFYLHPYAVLYHRHPSNNPAEIDQTHRDARIRRDQDHALMKQREAAGLIWGITG